MRSPLCVYVTRGHVIQDYVKCTSKHPRKQVVHSQLSASLRSLMVGKLGVCVQGPKPRCSESLLA